MASKYWIKLYHEILDDHKMGRMPDGLWRRTIELFLIAGEYDHGGVLPCFEDIAWRLRISDDGLMEDLQDLSDIGIIKENDDGRYIVIKFADRQSPMSNEERGRRFRESHQKQEYNETHYDDERETNDTFADKDKIISDIDNMIEEKEKDKHMLSQSPHSLALTDDNGELIPEEDRIIEIFCDRVGLRGNTRPYEGDPSNRKWYADWLKEAGEIQKLGISSGEMGEAIAILKSSNYPCKHPSAIIETVKNIRKDRELFEKGEKKKLHRFKLQKYTEADGDWNYQPIDWWEEK